VSWPRAALGGSDLGLAGLKVTVVIERHFGISDSPGVGHPWLKLAIPVLACVGAGGRADETPEVPVQLALIVEPDSLRDFARLHACG